MTTHTTPVTRLTAHVTQLTACVTQLAARVTRLAVKVRYWYRFKRLTAMCKRMQLRMLIDNRQTYRDPVFLVHNTSIQVGLFLCDRKVRLYVHVDQSHPFVLAHIIVQLCSMFSVAVCGTYKSQVDNTTSSVRHFNIGAKNDNITYH